MATPLHTEHSYLPKTMTPSPMIYSPSLALLGNERSTYYPLSSPLQPPLTASEKPSKETKLAMQEIAKEALRLTKETLAHDYTKVNNNNTGT